MPTLATLADEGWHLLRWEVLLGPGEFDERFLYLVPRLAPTLQEELPTWGSSWNIYTQPLEQLDALTYEYATGQPLAYGRQLKPLVHHGDGVWELKTADLRIFGWFPKKDHFIAVRVLTAEHVKQHNLYHGLVGEVRRAIEVMPLDEPKFIPGDDPDAVISTFYYPS